MMGDQPEVTVDRERGTITVGTLTYAISILAEGMATPDGMWVRMRPAGDAMEVTVATSGHIAAEWLQGRDAARDA